jgi:membrane fusion protein, multidrug efflux system
MMKNKYTSKAINLGSKLKFQILEITGFSMKKVPILLFFIAIATSCGEQSKNNQVQGGRRNAGPVPVEVRIIEPEVMINRIQATGSVLAVEMVDIKPEVPGIVTGVFFEEGSMVEKGKLLIKLNDQDLQAQLERSEAQCKILENEEYRKKKLLDIKAISLEEYETAYQQWMIARAEKKMILANIAKTEIRAPFTGRTGLRQISPGAYLSTNSVVVTLAQSDPVRIDFDIPEKYAGMMQTGMQINFTNEKNDSVFIGKVTAVESAISSGTRTLKVRATAPNLDRVHKPGAFARVTIVLEEFRDAIGIPAEALLTELSGNAVYIKQNGKASKRIVKTGIRTEHEIQITEGLSFDDSLIVTGLLQLTDGMPVTSRSKQNK